MSAGERELLTDGSETLSADETAAHDEKGPLRLCAVTRRTAPPGELLRFVLDPQGDVVLDLKRSLPGRGVWVTPDRATVAQAARQNVFARSLKRQVKLQAGLEARVDAALEQKVLQSLSLANKAGILTSGFSQVDAALDKGGVAILINAADAAPGGKEKLARKHVAIANANGRSPQFCEELTVQQMSLAIGGINVVHAALNHGGAAQKFATEAGRLKRYRSGVEVLERE